MFRDRAIQMKLVSSLIFGGVILGVEIKSGKGGDLQPDLAAQVADRRTWFKSPVVSADVCQVTFVEGAAWGIYPKLALPLKVPVFSIPSSQEISLYRRSRWPYLPYERSELVFCRSAPRLPEPSAKHKVREAQRHIVRPVFSKAPGTGITTCRNRRSPSHPLSADRQIPSPSWRLRYLRNM